jgi:predicted Ser/Thr protein kinase
MRSFDTQKMVYSSSSINTMHDDPVAAPPPPVHLCDIATWNSLHPSIAGSGHESIHKLCEQMTDTDHSCITCFDHEDDSASIACLTTAPSIDFFSTQSSQHELDPIDHDTLSLSNITLFSTHSPTLSIEKLREGRREGVLGKGAYGTAFKYKLSDGTFICQKTIKLHEDADQRAKQLSEVAIMQTLQHQYILNFIGHDIVRCGSNRVLHLYVEYAPGGTLCAAAAKEIVRQQVTTNNSEWLCRLRTWSRQLLEAVRYLHDNGIAHRDIKGANVLLTADGNIKLADFGLAETFNGFSNELISFAGTPYFMPPELMRGEATRLHMSGLDIWAVGCVVVEMLTGRPPWPKFGNVNQIMYHISINERPTELPKHIDTETNHFLNKCFCKLSEMPTPQTLMMHPFVRTNEHSAARREGCVAAPSSPLIDKLT